MSLLAPDLVFFLLPMGLLILRLLGPGENLKLVTLLMAASLAASLALVSLSIGGPSATFFGGSLIVDGFSQLLKLAALLTGLFVFTSALPFLQDYEYRVEFVAYVGFVTFAIMLLCSVGDWILLFLSLEFTSIVSYILAGHRRDARSAEAALKYFLLGAVCTGFFLFGIALLYGLTGTTNLMQMASNLGSQTWAGSEVFMLSLLLILVGFGFKLALFPFHMWAPDAYEGAPTPVTAFLSVGPKIGGFAVLLRFFLTAFAHLQTEWFQILAVCAILSMTLGNCVALHQQNIKRMLAYSTIAHMGYALVGFLSVGATDPLTSDHGYRSVLFYVFAYLFTNLGLFAAVMAVEKGRKTEHIPAYAGLSKQNPFLALSIVVFLLSLTGIPPLAGFMGKFMVFAAAVNQHLIVLAVVGFVNSAISAYYYLGVARYMYLVEAKTEKAVSIPLSHLFCIVLGLTFTLLLCLFPGPFLNMLSSTSLHRPY